MNIDIANNRVSGWVFAQGSLSGRFGGCKAFFDGKISNAKIIEYGVFDNNGVK